MAISNKLAKLMAVCFAIGLVPSMALAYPGALNLIPNTDIIGANNLRLSYESEGTDQPYDDGYTEYFYTQFGIGDKLEVGYDVYDVDGASTKYFNAKYLVIPEGEKMPAVAVGTMFVGEDSKSSYYTVGSKKFGKICYHLGAQTQSDRNWLLLGANYELSDTVSLLADYQSGQGHYQTLGIYWQQSPQFGITLYGVRNNTESLRDGSDYIGLNFGYTLSVK